MTDEGDGGDGDNDDDHDDDGDDDSDDDDDDDDDDDGDEGDGDDEGDGIRDIIYAYRGIGSAGGGVFLQCACMPVSHCRDVRPGIPDSAAAHGPLAWRGVTRQMCDPRC